MLLFLFSNFPKSIYQYLSMKTFWLFLSSLKSSVYNESVKAMEKVDEIYSWKVFEISPFILECSPNHKDIYH